MTLCNLEISGNSFIGSVIDTVGLAVSALYELVRRVISAVGNLFACFSSVTASRTPVTPAVITPISSPAATALPVVARARAVREAMETVETTATATSPADVPPASTAPARNASETREAVEAVAVPPPAAVESPRAAPSTNSEGLNIHSDEYWNIQATKINAISDPRKKFLAFDQFTDEVLLQFVPFSVFRNLALSTNYPGGLPDDTFGSLTPQYVRDGISLINRCVQLSEDTMKNVRAEAVSDLCARPDNYIRTKLFHATYNIFRTPNFSRICSQGPLFLLNNKMWEMQGYNHGKACSCFVHLTPRFALTNT